MKYLILTKKANALARSAEIATALGCGRKPEDVTRYWFGVVEHPTTKQGALEIPDASEESRLRAGEKLALQEKAVLDAGEWFETDTGKR